MRFRTPTMDLLAKEFAEAVAEGDAERAEGWLAVAQLAATRQRPRRSAWRLRSRANDVPVVVRTP